MTHDPDSQAPSPARGTPTGMAVLTASEKGVLLAWTRTVILASLRGDPAPQLQGVDEFVIPGCFVTLRRVDTGSLRGCRGVLFRPRPIAESLAFAAQAAALDDPRFSPVLEAEMGAIAIEISLLTEPAPIDPDSIEVGRHGLIVRALGRVGLLLPSVAVDYGWDAPAFLDAVCAKAGLPAGAWRRRGAELLGFETVSWHEASWPERSVGVQPGGRGQPGPEPG